MPPLAVLVGPPGAGKTVVGQALAARLNAAFRDTDDDVEAAAGTSVSDIFVLQGEAVFRELERVAVAEALAAHDGVLALGGGAVMDESTRAALTAPGAPPVVFLTVEINDAARRVGFNRDRPLLLGNPRRMWVDLMRARRPVYEQVADHVVATDGREPDEIAAEIAVLIGAEAGPYRPARPKAAPAQTGGYDEDHVHDLASRVWVDTPSLRPTRDDRPDEPEDPA